MEKRTVYNKAVFIGEEEEGSVSQSTPREKVNKVNFMKTADEKQKLKDLKKQYKQSLNNK